MHYTIVGKYTKFMCVKLAMTLLAPGKFTYKIRWDLTAIDDTIIEI